MTRRLLIVALCSTALSVLAADKTEFAAITPQQVIHLANNAPDCLAQFDTWIAGHGLNRDPERVFRMEKGAAGRPLLRVTGHGYGGLITKRSYRDYRLVVEFRWTGRTSGQREKNARDNGLLLHCTGRPGNCAAANSKFPGQFESPWMKGVELQIIEGGVGDLLVLGGWKEDGTFWPTTLRARYGKDRDAEPVFDKNAELRPFEDFRLNWWGRDPDWKDEIGFRGKQDVESPMGEWTRVEAIVRGGDFTYFVNGKLVNEAKDCSMTEGRIFIQTEGAEILFRKLDLEPLKATP
jgi:hypothetical protein